MKLYTETGKVIKKKDRSEHARKTRKRKYAKQNESKHGD